MILSTIPYTAGFLTILNLMVKALRPIKYQLSSTTALHFHVHSGIIEVEGDRTMIVDIISQGHRNSYNIITSFLPS